MYLYILSIYVVDRETSIYRYITLGLIELVLVILRLIGPVLLVQQYNNNNSTTGLCPHLGLGQYNFDSPLKLKMDFEKPT
jgi:hypothetical protein